MKRLTSLILIIAIMVSLVACGNQGNSNSTKIIASTIYPTYDWAKNLTEGIEDIEVILINDKGTDLHSFEPTANDLITVTSSDCVMHMDENWIHSVVGDRKGSSVWCPLLVTLQDQELALREIDHNLLQWDSESSTGAGRGKNIDFVETDDHFWLSIKVAKGLVPILRNVLYQVLTTGNTKGVDEKVEILNRNYHEYLDKLDALDKKYEEVIAEAGTKTLLFGDRFPFLYLAADYGLTAYAAFSGCSAETEASFATVTALANTVDELKLKTILTIDGSNGEVAKTIRDNTKTKDQQILTLNSLQAVTAKDIENGITYLSVMEKNLEVLKEALK